MGSLEQNRRSSYIFSVVPLTLLGLAGALAPEALAVEPTGDDPPRRERKDSDRPARRFPALPGAVHQPLESVTKDAPFDVAAFFTPPPREENAAPLYLDAMFEFTAEVADCYPEDERKKRLPVARRRAKERERVIIALIEDARSVPKADIDALLADHRPGFEKLARAQQRPRCMFVAGLGITTDLPHLLAAREVVRLLDLRVMRDAGRGKFDRALDGVEMTLRLSRDVRPRGYVNSQMVSVAMDSIVAASMIPRILTAEGLTAEHCDRMLGAFQRHRADGTDLFSEGLKMEYLTARKALDDIQHRTGEFDRRAMKEWLEQKLQEYNLQLQQPEVTIGDVIVKLTGTRQGEPKGTEVARRIDEKLAEMTPADFEKEIERLNETYREVAKAASQPYEERTETLARVQSRLERARVKGESIILRLFPDYRGVAEGITRHAARLAGTECLIALRRWQLGNPGKPPRDLLTVVKAAGMKQVPTDPYSGRPMKLTTIDGKPVIYSVGSDGNDDRAMRDWNLGSEPGDFIFRLEPPE